MLLAVLYSLIFTKLAISFGIEFSIMVTVWLNRIICLLECFDEVSPEIKN